MPRTDAISAQLPARSSAAKRNIDGEVLCAFPGVPRGELPTAGLAQVSLGLRVDRALADGLVAFTADFIEQAATIGINGLVVGLSGGVDSIVCAELARRAVASPTQVAAVTVLIGSPEERRRLEGLGDCASRLGLQHVLVDGAPTQARLQAAWSATGPWTAINTETRTIQALVFQVADSLSAAVVATTDRSEALLGRFTEGFYGHVAPLAELYKSEVIELAEHLGVASAIQSSRPGCEGHWYDDEVLGAGYDVVDPVLHLLSENALSPEQISLTYGIEDVEWIRALHRRVQHQPLRIGTRSFAPGRERSS